MPPVKTFGERIADALVEDGLLSLKQVEALLEQQKKEGTRLLKLILEKSYGSEQDMAVSMGRVLNTPPINLSRVSVPIDIAELLPREMAHTHKVIPVSRLENKLPQATKTKRDVQDDADNVEVTEEGLEQVKLDQLAASSDEAPVIKLANLDVV